MLSHTHTMDASYRSICLGPPSASGQRQQTLVDASPWMGENARRRGITRASHLSEGPARPQTRRYVAVYVHRLCLIHTYIYTRH